MAVCSPWLWFPDEQHKREVSRDVIDTRITLVKDVRLDNPHAAHVRILEGLAITKLLERSPANFTSLYEAWKQALSIQELNKNFYRELANWYFWATKVVRFPPNDGESEEARNAISVIRLLTRLIFIWFIKERDLVPQNLFDLEKLDALLKASPAQAPEESHYYKAILQNLFFATLNTDMGDEDRGVFAARTSPEGRTAISASTTSIATKTCSSPRNRRWRCSRTCRS